jgi:hypothetical protein
MLATIMIGITLRSGIGKVTDDEGSLKLMDGTISSF